MPRRALLVLLAVIGGCASSNGDARTTPPSDAGAPPKTSDAPSNGPDATTDAAPPDAGAPARPPPRIAIVVNDASPTSIAIGARYAHARAIPDTIHVSCGDAAASQDDETIDYDFYRSQIEAPIRKYLDLHPTIDFLVTTKGVPLRIAGAPTGEAFSGTTLTSLDSNLAALDYDKIDGAVKVTFDDPGGSAKGTAWLNRYWNARAPFDHATFGGYLVTRLDAYTKEQALDLVDRGIAAESRTPVGNVLLDLEPEFGKGEPSQMPAPITDTTITKEADWSSYNADMLHARDVVSFRMSVLVDETITFVGDKVDLLGYFSWGSNDSHYSQTAYRSLRFAPGAVGDTAVSTSARSFFPQKEGQSMIADLVAQGITGVKGYTDEPLLQANASPSILLDRYADGFTLAESFYAASSFVGWTDVVIGDALTRPYAKK